MKDKKDSSNTGSGVGWYTVLFSAYVWQQKTETIPNPWFRFFLKPKIRRVNYLGWDRFSTILEREQALLLLDDPTFKGAAWGLLYACLARVGVDNVRDVRIDNATRTGWVTGLDGGGGAKT